MPSPISLENAMEWNDIKSPLFAIRLFSGYEDLFLFYSEMVFNKVPVWEKNPTGINFYV